MEICNHTFNGKWNEADSTIKSKLISIIIIPSICMDVVYLRFVIIKYTRLQLPRAKLFG